MISCSFSALTRDGFLLLFLGAEKDETCFCLVVSLRVLSLSMCTPRRSRCPTKRENSPPPLPQMHTPVQRMDVVIASACPSLTFTALEYNASSFLSPPRISPKCRCLSLNGPVRPIGPLILICIYTRLFTVPVSLSMLCTLFVGCTAPGAASSPSSVPPFTKFPLGLF